MLIPGAAATWFRRSSPQYWVSCFISKQYGGGSNPFLPGKSFFTRKKKDDNTENRNVDA